MEDDIHELDCSMEHECVICLESMDENANSVIECESCRNIFHKKCIYKLQKKECPLCRERIQLNNSTNFNIVFNNMNEDDVYDIDKYVNKWGRKTCLSNDHRFCLETLGDWGLSDTGLVFKYTCMHIQCIDCDISTIMK